MNIEVNLFTKNGEWVKTREYFISDYVHLGLTLNKQSLTIRQYLIDLLEKSKINYICVSNDKSLGIPLMYIPKGWLNET